MNYRKNNLIKKEISKHLDNNRVLLRTGQELVFGKNSVLEIIENSQVQVNKIWLSENLQDRNLKEKVISYAKERKIPFHIVPAGKITKIADNQNHQGLILSISPIKYSTVDEIITYTLEEASSLKVILVANETQDTHNLGAMIRTFVASGGQGVILTGRSNVGINATVVKTSAGALFQARFARAINCVNVLNELKNKGFWIVGTDNSNNVQSVYSMECPNQIAIVVGNEHGGLGQLVKKNCDFLVKVPISGTVDSLNVSVAFGIILFELLRQKTFVSTKTL